MVNIEESLQQSAKDKVLNIFPAVMMEKGYGKITVHDILKQANIGRTTFYAHFTSKEDVLRGSVDRLRDSLLYAVNQNSPADKNARLAFTFHFFDHIISHHKFYDDIIGREDFYVVERYILRMLTDLVSRDFEFKPGGNTQNLKLELIVQYIVGAVWSTSVLAIERQQLSAKAINECFLGMALPGLEKFVKTL